MGAAILYFKHGARTFEGRNLKRRKGRLCGSSCQGGGRCLGYCLGGLCCQQGFGGGLRCTVAIKVTVQICPWAVEQTAFFLLRNQQVGRSPNGTGARFVIGKQPSRAARKNKACGRGLSAQSEYSVARVPFALGGDGATVHAHHIRQRGGVAFHTALSKPGFAQGLGLVLIDLAAKGDQIEFPGRHGADVRKSACLDKPEAARLSACQYYCSLFFCAVLLARMPKVRNLKTWPRAVFRKVRPLRLRQLDCQQSCQLIWTTPGVWICIVCGGLTPRLQA